MIASVAAIADVERAAALQRYFKTGPGEYGAGDVFAGLRVPDVRKIARSYADLPLPEVDRLLDSDIHEHRLAALEILVFQFRRANSPKRYQAALREQISNLYIAAVRRQRVNNWDLIDGSAPTILGELLYDRPRDLLFEFARSESIWERRVAVLSTFGFLKHGDASTSLEIATLLIDDNHPLIHKAVGWMLREIGARISRQTLCDFLDANAARMPRTMLSYATEHFAPPLREHYRKLRPPAAR